MTNKLRVTFAAATALAALGIAGCSPGDLLESAVESAVEKGIESATGAEFDFDEEGGSFSIETEDGSFSVGTDGELPEGFPKDQVPMIDGDIIQAAKVSEGGSDGFMVTITAQGDPDDVFDKANAQMKSAGYSESSATNLGDELRSVIYEGADGIKSVAVNFLVDADAGVTQVSYLVTLPEA